MDNALGPKCADEFKSAVAQFTILQGTIAGRKELTKKFYMCSSWENATSQDASTLIKKYARALSIIAAYRDSSPYDTAKTVCSWMTYDTYKTPLDRFSEMAMPNVVKKCNNFTYKAAVGDLADLGWDKWYVEGKLFFSV